MRAGPSCSLETSDDLVAVLARGQRHRRRDASARRSGIAGRVAATREALLIEGQADPSQFPGLTPREQQVVSALSIPLVSRDKLFGVLNVNAGPDRRYTCLRPAGGVPCSPSRRPALANARLYETERMHALRAELGKEFGGLHAEAASDL